ncbi:hypothetical protein WDZ17_09520 [Pseudokineococcus basanitobsidens]|uniref:HEAT repeat protein n=1 Tax=Pseudokineococcus basanitobsidens TaxID=1926649 RepID=A0ABU8RKQ0_9ACTN
MARRRAALPDDLSTVGADALHAALRNARGGDRDRLVGRVVAAGETGDRLLAEVLPLVAPSLAGMVAAGLGDVRGPYGDAVLRSAVDVTGPGTSDLRCSAVLSLAKRGGQQASADLARAWGARDWGTRMYALHCLAATGDGRVLEEVSTWLGRRLGGARTRVMGMPTDVVLGVVYVLRHADTDGTERLRRLLRRRWERLDPDEQEWLELRWPGAAPGGPDAPASDGAGTPDREALRAEVAADALFAASDWSGRWDDEEWSSVTTLVPDGDGGLTLVTVDHVSADAEAVHALLDVFVSGQDRGEDSTGPGR